MKIRTNLLAALLTALTILLVRPTGAVPAIVPGDNTSNTQVHMVVLVEALKEGDKVSAMKAEDVRVQQGRNSLRVTGWIPSRGEQAGLQLFILIDDTSNTSLGSQLADVREFIMGQPATTWIGLGYMRNTSVTIVQNFTNEHQQVVKALRLPLGSTGASDSPYLSLIG